MTENYRGCYEYLSAQFEQVGGCEFYRELFPDNEKTGEDNRDFFKPNAVYLYSDENRPKNRKLRRRIMLDDVWEQDYMEFVEQNPLTLCSGLAYRGMANKLKNAQRMNALIFDLDGVGVGELRNLFLRFGGGSAACPAAAYADFPCSVRKRAAPVLCVRGTDRSVPEY